MKFGRIAIVSLMAVLGTTSFATDFGLLESSKVSTNNTLQNPGDKIPIDNSNNFKLWLDLSTSETSKIYLSGFYQLGVNSTAKEIVSHSYDLTDLYFKTSLGEQGEGKTLVDLTIGRTLFYDFSGLVLAHKLDGVLANIKSDNTKLKIGVGTTAGLFNKTSGIILSTFDQTAQTKPEVLFASPRLISQIGVGFNDILSKKTNKDALDMNLSLEVLYQTDLRSDVYHEGDTIGTDKSVPVNTAYIGGGLQGKLGEGFFYKLNGYFEYGTTLRAEGTSYTADTILAGMGDLTLNLFFKEFLNSRLDIGFNLSTGDEDAKEGLSPEQNISGQNTSFFGISKRGGGYIFAPQFGNSYVGRVSWIGKLVDPVMDGDPSVSLDFDYFLFGRIVNGPIAQSGVLKSGTTRSVLAQEIDTSLSFRLLSDLSVKLLGGLFLPDDQALASNSLPSKWKAGLELNLSF